MRTGIASDHGGFDLKRKIASSLKQAGFDVVDYGAHQLDPADDYPPTTLSPWFELLQLER